MVTQAENLTAKYAAAPLETILDVYVAYPNSAAVIRDFLNLFEVLKPFSFGGVGMEIGAGIAVFSSMICKRFPEVKCIYSIEVVSGVVEKLRPTVIDHLAPEHRSKIVNVVGSFNDIDLKDGSCDFCVENSSLHHSHDLPVTLQEINRKLRIGGHLLVVDRAHNDSLSEEQRNLMLDLVYDKETMEKNGFVGERLTRRQNGEHEIRLCEWMRAITDAGFVIDRHFELRTTGLKKFIRALILKIPFPIRRVLNILPTRVSGHPGELWWLFLSLLGGHGRSGTFVRGYRDYSVFLARKTSDVAPRTTPLGA